MSESQDIVVHARKWPLIVLVAGATVQALYVGFTVHSMADLPTRVATIERYLEADRARHQAQDQGIRQYYNVTLPKLQQDAADMKADMATVRAEIRAMRDAIEGLREDIRSNRRSRSQASQQGPKP